MVKKVPRKKYDSAKYSNFLKVADNFSQAADIAAEFEYYNAAGVLIIHSAIALADSVTIRFSSVKCTGENHYEVIKLLQESVADSKSTAKALTHFEKLIDHKNAVSYQGEVYQQKDITILLKHFYRFEKWVKSLIG
ncbi:MAG: hypothetical protein K8F36_07835 [Melioribacteraceae bacterium]|nr:hypothetical protein [Melioribacteraceae bacterium]MCO6473342.1 hypothetical protein [Melioribacteraceae bacterium]MDD3558626.1 hypothetical protein [Melioribacteraceae bacterium]